MGLLNTIHPWLVMALLVLESLAPSISRAAAVTVPFVGCATEGMGEATAPAGKPPVAVSLPPNEAGELAFYGPNGGGGTLAPRNWHCVVYVGTRGGTLVVTPDPVGDSDTGYSGPALVQVGVDGGTGSGFETIQDYLQKAYPDAGHRPTGHDELTYPKDHLVIFTTPPNVRGLGTLEFLRPSPLPIHGYLQYDPTGDSSLELVELRVPKKLNWLTKAILGTPAIK